MKKLTFLAYPLIALASLAAAGSALADDITPDNTARALSTKSRAQVQAELVQARADGSIKVWSTSYNPFLTAKSLKTRDEVRAEVLADRGAAYAGNFYGEDSGSFALNRARPARQAAPQYAGTVKAGAQQ